MPKFIVELKEVYIVKYRCTASSKEEIEKIFIEDYFHFGSRCKLEPIQDSMEYFGDTGSGDALHSIRTIEEYNKDNEEGSAQGSKELVSDTYDPFETAKEILNSDEEDEFVIE
jgi:hypothetical protein